MKFKFTFELPLHTDLNIEVDNFDEAIIIILLKKKVQSI